jgi:hypothetical protein
MRAIYRLPPPRHDARREADTVDDEPVGRCDLRYGDGRDPLRRLRCCDYGRRRGGCGARAARAPRGDLGADRVPHVGGRQLVARRFAVADHRDAVATGRVAALPVVVEADRLGAAPASVADGQDGVLLRRAGDARRRRVGRCAARGLNDSAGLRRRRSAPAAVTRGHDDAKPVADVDGRDRIALAVRARDRGAVCTRGVIALPLVAVRARRVRPFPRVGAEEQAVLRRLRDRRRRGVRGRRLRGRRRDHRRGRNPYSWVDATVTAEPSATEAARPAPTRRTRPSSRASRCSRPLCLLISSSSLFAPSPSSEPGATAEEVDRGTKLRGSYRALRQRQLLDCRVGQKVHLHHGAIKPRPRRASASRLAGLVHTAICRTRNG